MCHRMAKKKKKRTPVRLHSRSTESELSFEPDPQAIHPQAHWNLRSAPIGYMYCFLFVCLFFAISGSHSWHMEVPRLGVKLDLCRRPTPQPQQHGIWAMSVTYTTAHDNTRSFIHLVKPGIEPATSWFLVRFVSSAPWQELPRLRFLTNALRLASSTKGESWEVNGANNPTFTNIFSHVYKYEIKGMRRLYYMFKVNQPVSCATAI